MRNLGEEKRERSREKRERGEKRERRENGLGSPVLFFSRRLKHAGEKGAGLEYDRVPDSSIR